MSRLRFRAACTLLLAWAQSSAVAQSRPAGVGVSVWLREDMFAGLLGNNYASLETGNRKARVILEQNPDDAAALTWSCMADIVLAIKAHEAKQNAEFQVEYGRGKQCFARSVQLAPDRAGVRAVAGLTWSVLAARLPDRFRAEARESAYEAWREGVKLSRPRFSDMPEHSKGELLAAAAQAAFRTGHRDEAMQYLLDTVSALPGSSYSRRAEVWMARNEAMEAANPSCQGCHEPGRLENVLKRLQQPPR